MVSAIVALTACNRVFYNPSRNSHGDAAKAGFAFEDVRNLTGAYKGYAWVVAEGYDLFLFDYRGYGASDGNATRRNLFEDGVAALRFAESRLRNAPPGKLVLGGESLGGAVLLGSVPAWEGRHKADLIFVDCTFPSYRKVARAILADRFYSWPFQILGNALVSDEYAPESGLDSLPPVPLLVTHCSLDDKVPYRMGEELFRRASEPKAFWRLEDCGHTRGFTDKYPENRKRLIAHIDSLGKPVP